MTAEPYYILTPCCVQPGVDQLFFIVGNNPLPTVPGTYQFNGLADFDLVRGACYSVTEALGVNLTYEYFPDNTEFIYLTDGCNDSLCLCADVCYVLTDCENLLDPIYTMSNGVSPFVGGVNSIIINGYTNCWTVAVSEGTCDCAIDVVVTQNFTNCELCLGYTSYKLTDCSNSANIMYTSTDLSLYVGQVVEQDCPGCWLVEEFNLQPPTNVPIVVTNTFDTCVQCQNIYWILEDCAEIEQSIITTTDLSAYNNQVITLEWCPTICWQVSSTRQHTNSTIVILKDNYQTCIECELDILPCQCSTILNNTLTAIVIPYYNCENTLVYTELVQPNKRSKKVCLKKWDTIGSDELYFGDCTLDIDRDFICPPVVYPKRTVRPGYNTPTCTIDHYEKIVCNFASAMYSNTLEKRYGITSCCPEDREKWEIQYELVEFASLVDPDYICTPVSTCCDPLPASSVGTCNNQ